MFRNLVDLGDKIKHKNCNFKSIDDEVVSLDMRGRRGDIERFN